MAVALRGELAEMVNRARRPRLSIHQCAVGSVRPRAQPGPLGGSYWCVPVDRLIHCFFYTADDEKLAGSDNMVVSTATIYQQTPGSILAARGAAVDPDATYLMKNAEHLIWPYDDTGRLVGEDVWEYDESVREIIPLDPTDVLTVEQSAKLLDPLIKPLPAYNPFTA
jgi:hypothetical protein